MNSCDPRIGCTTIPKSAEVIASQCNDTNRCTIDTCNLATGQCVNTPGAVQCPSNDQCSNYTCNPRTGLCDRATRSCVSTNPCLVPSCNGTFPGGCQFSLVTDVATVTAICRPTSCQNATCTLSGCLISPIIPIPPVCSPCSSNPCTNRDTFCVQHSCITEVTGSGSCADITDSTIRSECEAVVGYGDNSTAGSPKRYCLASSKVNACPANTACARYTCNATSNQCDFVDLGAACNRANDCQKNVCSRETGCGVLNKTAEEAALVCANGDRCVNVQCDFSTGGCIRTNVTCPAADLCSVSVCSPSTGCGTVSKTPAEIRAVCDDQNACTADTCVNGACRYTPDVVCSTNTSCASFYCNRTTGGCERIDVTCNDGDICTTDSCNSASGCVFSNLSPSVLSSVCPPRTCQISSCPRGSNNCSYTPDVTLGSCACANFPCTSFAATFCDVPVCVSSAPGSLTCMDLPVNQQQACLAQLSNPSPTAQNPLRFCGTVPTNACPRNSVCTNYTCNAAAGRCDVINLEPFCPPAPNQCSVSFCNASGTGCTIRPKTVAEVRQICDDSSLCTTDTCDGATGRCVFTPIPPCSGGDLCVEAFCSPSQGCSTRPKNASTIARLCNDTNACTIDTCSANQCVYTPTNVCPSNTSCSLYSCNRVTGLCDRTSVNCPSGTLCQTKSCDESRGGCVLDDIVCPSAFCKLGVCSLTNGTCGLVNDMSLPCQCENNPCTPLDNFCVSRVCFNSAAQCSSIVNNAAAKQACETSVLTNGVRYCYDQPKAVCASNLCNTFVCNASSSRCDVATTRSCNSNNRCVDDSCDGSTGCISTPKSLSAASLLCDDQNSCTADSCNASAPGGACVHTRLTTPECTSCASGGGCNRTNDACFPTTCHDNCASPQVANRTACNLAKLQRGFYCETLDIQVISCAPRNDVCTTYQCVAGTCVPNFRRCNVSSPCQVGTCSLAVGGCVYSDPCTNIRIADKCREPTCVVSSAFANGYTCYDPSSTARNCTDFVCRATNVTTRMLLGPQADEFLTQYRTLNPRCEPRLCTDDICDASVGCVNRPVTCFVNESGCNVTLGCFDVGNVQGFPPGVCQEQVVRSLIDFCGVCKGDNVACFFATLNTGAVAGGIAGGVVAGITIGVIVAALLSIWGARKGYEYYQVKYDTYMCLFHLLFHLCVFFVLCRFCVLFVPCRLFLFDFLSCALLFVSFSQFFSQIKAKSDLQSAGMHTNPYFNPNELSGAMPGTQRGLD